MQDALTEAANDAVDVVRDDLQEDGSSLLLPAVLDLKAAAPLAAAFLARRHTDLMVDGAAVQRMGGQCLQVLLSALQSWAADGCRLQIENASPEFCSAAELFGAGSVLFLQQKETSL